MRSKETPMVETKLERRDFLRGLAALGLSGALPLQALARAAGGDWPMVRAVLDSLAPAKLPGLAGAIGRDTAPADFLFAGTLAKDSATKIDADTLWRVYSMTKPITGMAAMMLIEDGKLKLDQNIADFLPGFANPRVLVDPAKDLESRPAKAPITVRNLLTHTAGLGYSIITKGPLLDAYNRLGILPGQVSRQKMPGVPYFPTAPSLAEFADRLATLPLIADPGVKWSYSISLDLLGRVIELASGKSFDGFLQERMFDPLGMTSTYWQVPASEAGRLVTNHFATAIGLIPIDPGATSIYLDKPAFPFGGAGLVMSARDYDRFLLMLAGQGAADGKRIMKTDTVKLGMSNLLVPGVDTAGTFAEGQGFGAGGRVVIAATPGGQGVGTYGWAGAAATIAWVDPVRGIRASGFAQYMPDAIYGFPKEFAKAVYADLA
jgi:CubicO group peptidase (beta-lactamase class C family)